MTIDEIRDQALHLSPQERAGLAQELIASLEGLDEASVEQLWLDEAERRDRLAGSGDWLPAEEVLARMASRIA